MIEKGVLKLRNAKSMELGINALYELLLHGAGNFLLQQGEKRCEAGKVS